MRDDIPVRVTPPDHVNMPTFPLRITYIGGPTALLELAGLRLLTDPTFDPAGTEYRTPVPQRIRYGDEGMVGHGDPRRVGTHPKLLVRTS